MPRSSGSPPRNARYPCALGIAVLLLALLPSTLEAQPRPSATIAADQPAPRRLTDRGRILLAGSVGGNWSNDAQGGYGSLKRWLVRGSPELAYFLRDRIGLGLALGAGASEYTSQNLTYREYQVAAGVTGAFEVPLSACFGLMFRPFLGYLHQWRKSLSVDFVSDGTSAPGALIQQQATSLMTQQSGSLRLWLSTQMLWHLSSSVALAAGPDVWVDAINASRTSWAQAAPTTPLSRSQRPQYYRVQVGLSISLLIGL